MVDPTNPSSPAWLPPLVRFSDYCRWESFIDAIYEYYLDDFVRTHFQVEGKRLALKRYPQTFGKDKAFWHLCGHDEGQDIPKDFSRCERIRWPKPIMLNHNDGTIKLWASDRFKHANGRRRILIWFNDEYLVVLEPRENYLLLVTAYPTQYKNTIVDLKRSYQTHKDASIEW